MIALIESVRLISLAKIYLHYPDIFAGVNVIKKIKQLIKMIVESIFNKYLKLSGQHNISIVIEYCILY